MSMLCNVWCLVRCPLVMCSFGKDLDEDMQRIAYILLPCVQLVFCCPDVICISWHLDIPSWCFAVHDRGSVQLAYDEDHLH